LNSATRLADEGIEIDGQAFDCSVVCFTDEDLKTASPGGKEVNTLWIDKTRKLVIKSVEREEETASEGPFKIPLIHERMKLFRVVELNPQIPAETFVFIPPAEAKLVDEFPKISSAKDGGCRLSRKTCPRASF
jgi:hypothetical protein